MLVFSLTLTKRKGAKFCCCNWWVYTILQRGYLIGYLQIIWMKFTVHAIQRITLCSRQCFLQQSDPSFANCGNHTFTNESGKSSTTGLRFLNFFGSLLNPTKLEMANFATCFLTTNALWYHLPKILKKILHVKTFPWFSKVQKLLWIK